MVAFGTLPKVRVQLVVEAGNAHEDANEVWLADTTGEMLQEGTTALTADALARELASMGGELSVTVGPDRTNVYTDVLAERGPHAAAPARRRRAAAAPAGVRAAARQSQPRALARDSAEHAAVDRAREVRRR